VRGMRRRKCEGPKRMRIVALPVTLWSEEMAERVQREGREWLKLLEAVDWERYKKRVAQAVKRAVQKFRREHPDEPVFTISIFTDPRVQWTCISFDTKEHVYEQVRRWREKGYEELAKMVEELGFCDNPAGFKYYKFYEVYHPELAPLCQLDHEDVEQEGAAFAWVEKHLADVVAKLVEEGVFTFENREEVVRIGINSPYDWFDRYMEI